RVRTGHLNPADIWIQAASAGEAFLALSILHTLAPPTPCKLLVTTTTDQGLDILQKGIKTRSAHANLDITLDRFPFDIPGTVSSAVQQVNPGTMVLLETELWPAHLHALKQSNTRILILNARLSARSGRHYKATRFLWKHLAPDQILATSAQDAARYARVFPDTPIRTMENIKFDIMDSAPGSHGPSDLDTLFPKKIPLSILASVRRQEEPEMVHLLKALKNDFPGQITAVFPRHMHRITPIAGLLKRAGISFQLRSELAAPVTGPTVILWDRFGELRKAYAHASSVFVGGSLKPLGGQNFIEPAVLGIPAVTGPWWDDFIWVGKEIFDRGIVTRCRDWQEVAGTMVSHLKAPADIPGRRQEATAYIKARQGGSVSACRAILDTLDT
ncbi:MAG: 3-deoxy-D-manno-octulosonic acid transferase, partial [Desulfobacterales bacterium]|nr:3-deoxy-D-manno-octulosonic acid transferase [Desulfobacterales bacterium]